MRLLVTGGAGYIGSVVTTALVERGHDVTVLDDLSTGHRDAVPEAARFVQGSIHDAAALLRAAGDGAAARVGVGVGVGVGEIDAVLHFAAKSLVGESMTHPASYWRANVGGTLALLDAMREHGIERIVFSSTAAVYGDAIQMPIREDAPCAPTSTYGATKLAIDMALTSYARAYGMAAVSLRYFNVAGAYGRLGERHAVETHLIPLALAAAAGEGASLSVYGDDYPTPDGTCIRDYIHVLDLADAHVLALDDAAAGEHRIYNLGLGAGASVRDVLTAIQSVTGRTVPHAIAPRRPGDPAVLIASGDAARRTLGWAPARTLDDMVADAWAARLMR